MRFLGLDLAWGRKNTSGGCVLDWDGAVATILDVQEALGDDAAIVAWVEQWGGDDGLLIGVDAPLLVPNETGERPCESELRRRFARFHAGAHPANRRLYGGDVRGERLVGLLEPLGIRHDPYLAEPRQEGVRQVMEVFPHPAHVVLFGLSKTLKYKAKPGRTYQSRWAALAEYARLLRTWETADPALVLPADWPRVDVTGRKASPLKRYEDGLDALTCAYIVLWYWRHGAAGAEVIGDMSGGYVVVPQNRYSTCAV